MIGDLLLFVAVIAWTVYTVEGREVVESSGIAHHRLDDHRRHAALPSAGRGRTAGSLLPGGHRPGLASCVVGRRVPDRDDERGRILALVWALAHLAAARVAVFTNLQPLATALLAQAFLANRSPPASSPQRRS